MVLISLENISKVYRIGNTKLVALDNINFRCNRGDMISIMGPSGSGKSTLMNLIGCLDRPSSGKYTLNQEDVSNLNDNQLAEIRNKNIGFVFQSFNLLPRISAISNVELPLIYARIRNRKKVALESLQKVGIEQRKSHLPSEMSGGEQQRVALARALVCNPPLLLADEPTGNLDSQTSYKIMELLCEQHRKGITIIIVTHEEDIAAYTDKTIYLRDGKIVDERTR